MQQFIQDLSANPHRYDFAQAMRLLTHFIKRSPVRIRPILKAEVMPTGDPSEIQYFSLKNNRAKLRFAKQALSGVKGVIPGYIYQELLAALHSDDHALKDFLDVFNQRYFELLSHLEVRPWLLVQNELHQDNTELLLEMAALRRSHKHFFQYSMLLSQGQRNLATLQQILNDFFGFSIKVSVRHAERRQLPVDSLTRLGGSAHYNSKAGQGFLLGKTCLTHFNHLVVSVHPGTQAELEQIQADPALAGAMLDVINHYLNDNTPVSVYLTVRRAYLKQPRLSADRSRAAKLGEVDCLAPERKPSESVRILLK